MITSFKFLIQADRILTDQNYVDHDLDIIHEFLITIDNNELIDYFNSTTIFSYKNDLDLYIETVNKVRNIFEEKEKYEKCLDLKMKLIEAEEIINAYKIKTHE